MNLSKKLNLRLHKYLPQILIVAIILLVYIQNLWFDFAYLDDNLIVFAEYEKIDSLSKIPNTFLGGYLLDNYYRPMIMISFIIDTAIAGQSSMMYHLTNLIFHICVSLLIYKLLFKLEIKQNVALLLSLIFAAHPINTNAVSWIVGRNDLLLAFFSLLSFLFFLEFYEKRKPFFLLLSNVFYLLAVLSKEVGLVLPSVFITNIFLFKGQQNLNKRNFLPFLYYLIPAGIYITLRLAISRIIIRDEIGVWSFIQNIYIIFEYLAKLFYFPGIEPLPIKNQFLIIVGIIVLLLIILTFFTTLKDIKNKKTFIWGILFFSIMILPSLFVRIQSDDGEFNYIDCRIYLPFFGLLVSLGAIIQSINFNKYNKFIVISMLILSAIYMLSSVYIKNEVYRNGKIFWSSVTNLHPMRASYWMGYGFYFYDKHSYLKAAECAEKAININPLIKEYYQKAFLSYEANGDLFKANDVLERSLKIDKQNPVTFVNLIKNYLKLKQKDKATALTENFLQLNIQNKKVQADLTSSLSYYYAQENQYQDAIKLMTLAIAVSPNNPIFYNDLGVFFIKVGQLDSAKVCFEKSIKFDPYNKIYQKNLNYVISTMDKYLQ